MGSNGTFYNNNNNNSSLTVKPSLSDTLMLSSLSGETRRNSNAKSALIVSCDMCPFESELSEMILHKRGHAVPAGKIDE